AFNRDEVTICDPQPGRKQRMDFAQRLRILVNQSADSTRLGARQIMGNDASGGENNWILIIGFFRCRLPFPRLKVRLSIGMIKPIAFIKARRPRMIGRGTRPEDAFFTIDPLPRDAVIVTNSAPGSDAEFVKNLFGRTVVEFARLPETSSDDTDNIPVGPRFVARINSVLVVKHT